MSRIYKAPLTIERLMRTYQDYRVNLLLGPIGGGKTTGILMTCLAAAMAQAPDAKGNRKTRIGVIRNTKPQLRDSCIRTVFDWLPPNGSSIVWRETDMTLILNFALTDGTRVYVEFLFRALDTEQDAQRLLSVEFGIIWLSEFREIPLQLLTDALSRTGRYPSAADGGATWHGIFAESNMPVRDSDWYNYMEVDKPSYTQVLKQPSGIAPNAENRSNLPADYYDTVMEGTTLAWQQAHVLVEYPDSLEGKAVYGQTFNRARHVAPNPIRPTRFESFSPTLLIGVDQGRNPAAVMGQHHAGGLLNILGELTGTNMGMEAFATTVLRPYLTNHFPGIPALVVLDPAGFAKSQVNDDSPADVLKRAGFKVVPAPTNDVQRRIEAVERFLLQAQGLQIDPGCTDLIRGLVGAYKFRARRDGELEDKPEKKHPISDLQDCLQYICLLAGGPNLGRLTKPAPERRKQQAPSRRAWF